MYLITCCVVAGTAYLRDPEVKYTRIEPLALDRSVERTRHPDYSLSSEKDENDIYLVVATYLVPMRIV